MQPHIPYIGSRAEQLEQGGGIDVIVDQNDLSRDELRAVYEESLEIVLNSVERLVENLSGKTVITADHGEMLGERARPIPVRTHEHPRSIYTPELVDIPWLVIDDGERRDITELPLRDDQAPGRATVYDHLEAMGYKM